MRDLIQRRSFLRWATLGFGVTVAGSSVVWWSLTPDHPVQQTTASGEVLETVAQGQLPSFARRGGPFVQDMYRYAVEQEQILRHIPCFCGCEQVGHRDNASCYIAEKLPDGAITFSMHGAM